MLIGFVVWQRFNPKEPLLPLGLFKDRNFALSNVAIALVGLAITAMPLPISFYYQVARGMLPTQSALMLAPMAVATLIMAPIVGRLTDRVNPKWVAVCGFSSPPLPALAVVADGSGHRAVEAAIPAALPRHRPVRHLVAAAATATRNLPMAQAGAGSGVYNMTRQVGAVLGSAAIAALINARLAVELPGFETGMAREAAGVDAAGRGPGRLQLRRWPSRCCCPRW